MKDSGVIFLKDWKPLVSSLSIENQIYFWELFTSYEYGVEQKCDNEFVKPIWNFIKSQLDNMKEKYNERVVERNRANGSKGGRPRKPKETEDIPENPVGFYETQKTPKDNENDNENDNNDNDNENKEKSDFVEFDGLKYPKSHIEHSRTYMSHEVSLQTFMQQNKIKSDDVGSVKALLMEFNKHLNIDGKHYEESKFKDYRQHFINWHRRVSPEMKSALKAPKKGKLPDGVQPAEWLS